MSYTPNKQFNEDAASTTGDLGTAVLAVRRDTPAVGSGTDGDYSTLNVASDGAVYTAPSWLETTFAVVDVNSTKVLDTAGYSTLIVSQDEAGDLVGARMTATGTLTGGGTVSMVPIAGPTSNESNFFTGTGSNTIWKPAGGSAAFDVTRFDSVTIAFTVLTSGTTTLAVRMFREPLGLHAFTKINQAGAKNNGQSGAEGGLGLPIIGLDRANMTWEFPDVDSTGAILVRGAAEDAVHTTGDVGFPALAVRRDTAAVGSGTDGDYSTVNVDGSGRLWVNGSGVTQPISGAVTNTVLSVVGGGTEATAQRVTIASDSTGVVSVDDNGSSLTVDNAGTFATQDSQALADNGGFTDGTSKVFPAGYIYDEVAGTVLTENDVAAGRINVNRAVVSTVEDGVTRGRYATVSAANALKVDGSAVTQPISGAVTNTVLSVVGGGTEATAQRVTIASDSTGVLSVDDNGSTLSIDDGAGSITVDNAGTFATQDSQVLTDNGGFTDGTSKLFAAGFIYDEVAGTVLTENDAAAARINLNRAQVGIIEDGATRGRWATVSAANALKVDGSAVTQPISGAVTNTVLSVVGGGAEATAQRVTIASDSTGVLSVDDNGSSLTVDAPVATPVFVRLSDGASAISTLPVSYATTGSGTATGALRVELPTNGTGTLATVSTVTNVATIGTSVTPGTSAAHLGKAEDAVAATGDTGLAVWAVRTDTPATTTDASGDYHPFEVDANGALWTHPIQPSFRIEVDSAGLTTATTAYTAGDTAGTEMSFASAARVSSWGGQIVSASLLDKSGRSSAITVELWLFKAASTPAADNAAADWSDANMANFIGIITFDSGSWKSTASNAINFQGNLGLGYSCSATTLFGSFVLRGVPSSNFYSAVSDLRVSLNLLRD